MSSDERGDAEAEEAEVVESINDYTNDEDWGKFESTSSKNRIGGIFRADKGGSFNLVLKNIERYQFKVSNNEEESGVVFCDPYE